MSLFGSGPIGDDDLRYRHIPGTLRSSSPLLRGHSPSLDPPRWLPITRKTKKTVLSKNKNNSENDIY